MVLVRCVCVFFFKWSGLKTILFFPPDKAENRQVHLFSLQDQWQRTAWTPKNYIPLFNRADSSERLTIL